MTADEEEAAVAAAAKASGDDGDDDDDDNDETLINHLAAKMQKAARRRDLSEVERLAGEQIRSAAREGRRRGKGRSANRRLGNDGARAERGDLSTVSARFLPVKPPGSPSNDAARGLPRLLFVDPRRRPARSTFVRSFVRSASAGGLSLPRYFRGRNHRYRTALGIPTASNCISVLRPERRGQQRGLRAYTARP